MRTTLELDDEVVAAARSLASAAGLSLGAAVSELARRGLHSGTGAVGAGVETEFPVLSGHPGHLVTDDLVAAHRDDE